MSDQNALIELARQYGGAAVGSPMPTPDFKTSNVPVDAHGVPVDAPRDTRGQIVTSADEEPGAIDKLNAMLGPLAHPQTLTDFARLLTLPVDTVRKAAISAVTSAAASGAARSIAGAGAKLAVKGAAAIGDVVDPDVVGVISPRAGKVIQIAQKLRARAAAAAPPPAAAEIPPTIGEAADAPPPAARAAGDTVAPAVSDAEQAVLDRTRGNGLPDQKALNEAALARRRAAYQASQVATASAPAADAPAWTPAKLRLTAEESKVAAKLVQQGKTDQQVQQAIEAARELVKRFGSPTLTPAQTRFPKGMRGGA